MKTIEQAETLLKEMMVHRRYLHENAELSEEEFGTTKYILAVLDEIGIPYIRPTETGAIAIIEGGKPGKVIGLRADNDALPIEEETGLPFASKNKGVMHACGHDFHTAALLGAAKMLWNMKQDISGTIKLIFQPAEEGVNSGAARMIEQGDLNDCEAFGAIHVNSAIPTGHISVEAGPRMAASSGLYVTIRGKGGHGGRPWETIDPIVTAAACILNLQPLIARELDAHNMVVASVGNIHGGTAKNIIPEEVTFEGTLRFYEPEVEQQLREKITRIIEKTAEAYRATADVFVSKSFPAVINDPALSAIARKTAEKIVGAENIIAFPSSLGNEDFAFYSRIAPILYANVGTMNQDLGTDYPHHHPRFDVDEKALSIGAAFYVQFALDCLA